MCRQGRAAEPQLLGDEEGGSRIVRSLEHLDEMVGSAASRIEFAKGEAREGRGPRRLLGEASHEEDGLLGTSQAGQRSRARDDEGGRTHGTTFVIQDLTDRTSSTNSSYTLSFSQAISESLVLEIVTTHDASGSGSSVDIRGVRSASSSRPVSTRQAASARAAWKSPGLEFTSWVDSVAAPAKSPLARRLHILEGEREVSRVLPARSPEDADRVCEAGRGPERSGEIDRERHVSGVRVGGAFQELEPFAPAALPGEGDAEFVERPRVTGSRLDRFPEAHLGLLDPVEESEGRSEFRPEERAGADRDRST